MGTKRGAIRIKMEEDIKLLEELVQNINRVNERTLDCEVKQWIKEKQALENLIKGYRELEEKNKQCIKAGDLERAVGFLMNRSITTEPQRAS